MKKRYVPLEKRSKKARKEYCAGQRNGWDGVVPVTRLIPGKNRREENARRRAAEAGM